jgi:hypothetical protein
MRRQAVIAATAVVAGASLIAATSAGAATHKKPKPLKVVGGSYPLSLPPDPTMEATGEAGMECVNVDPASADNHPLALPGTGLLKIVLDSPDPAKNKLDWDLYLLDAKGNSLASSHGATAHEEIDMPNTRGHVTIRACNLLGEPTATVSWNFHYR